ncbi:hypothetical protein F0562_002268 [Nyssa sinensis]|uniref:Cytochrome P450 n=1 Tax=Nyssa sinensis TaxID=561372 RepID=A0A5J5C6W6_9ASTE|nr:hypothetical protein F0562_002268 [Nyssa sinensis]
MVLYKSRRNRAIFKKSKSIEAPRPSGEWPLIGHLPLLGGQLPVARTLEAMADRYGPVFSVGKYLGYDHAVFALAPYGPYWRDVRKMVIMELFTNQRLEKLKHVHASELDSCMKDLHLLCLKNGERPTKVAMNNWFENVTFNISLRMLVGKRFSTSSTDESDSDTGHFKEAITKALYLSGFIVPSDAIPWLEWMDFGGYLKAMKETAMEIDAFIANWLEEHIQKRMKGDTCGEEDFMDVMLSTLAEVTIMSGHNRDTIIRATTMPERFLTTHTNVNVKGQHYEYIPFSTGRRMCLGLTFGSQVVHLTLARVLHGFDIMTLMEGSSLAMPKVSPLEVICTPHLPLELYRNLETLASI